MRNPAIRPEWSEDCCCGLTWFQLSHVQKTRERSADTWPWACDQLPHPLQGSWFHTPPPWLLQQLTRAQATQSFFQLLGRRQLHVSSGKNCSFHTVGIDPSSNKKWKKKIRNVTLMKVSAFFILSVNYVCTYAFFVPGIFQWCRWFLVHCPLSEKWEKVAVLAWRTDRNIVGKLMRLHFFVWRVSIWCKPYRSAILRSWTRSQEFQ